MHSRPRPIRRSALTILVGALLALPALALAADPRPGRYVGENAQGGGVSVTVNRAANRVRKFRIRYRTACDNGETLRVIFDYRNLRIRRSDHFSGVGESVRRREDGTTITHLVRVRGHFVSRHKVVGRWTGRVETDRGDTTVSCAVRRLPWSARR